VDGSRSGHGGTSDGRLEADLSVPKEMGGDGGPGTNPGQLFAVGYAACFQSALLGVARGRTLDASDSTIVARVGIGPTGHGSRWICTRRIWLERRPRTSCCRLTSAVPTRMPRAAMSTSR